MRGNNHRGGGGRDGEGRGSGRRGGGTAGRYHHQGQQYSQTGGGRSFRAQQPVQQWPRNQVQAHQELRHMTMRPAATENRGGGRNVAEAAQPPPPQRRATPLPLSGDQTSVKGKEEKLVPVKRPESGGESVGRTISVLANCFPVNYDSERTLLRYDVNIESEKPAEGSSRERTLKKSDLFILWDKLFSDHPSLFRKGVAVFDGKSVFSSVELPTGEFKLNILDGEDTKSGSYLVSINFVNKYRYSVLNDYLKGVIEKSPEDILQGFNLVMKENPSRNRICFGRSTYPFHFRREDDLRCGVAAFRGFQQSLKLTSDGLALFLDTSVLPFRKSIPVIEYLEDTIPNFQGINDVNNMREDVVTALKGLKVTVNHRTTNQKFVVMGLTEQVTRDISFNWVDRDGKVLPKTVVDYFDETCGKNIEHKHIPCLELGTRRDAVPMEFCDIAEGQRYPKEKLNPTAANKLRNISVVTPAERKQKIREIIRSNDGPCGGQVAKNFGFEVDTDMTNVMARVLDPPTVKLGNRTNASLDQSKCHWNLVRKSLVKGVPIQRWALIDFRGGRLNRNRFMPQLMQRCTSLGIHMDEPLAVQTTNMDQLRSVEDVRWWLGAVIEEAGQKTKGRLQLIVCAMDRKHQGYNLLKYVSEKEIGVLTQCMLTENANKGNNDQFLANLALKINAKVGGSNFELREPLSGLQNENNHVMFVGADVNHPAPMDNTSPSIAAVVATVNWPAANKYAARVCPQDNRKETIVNFGSMCLDLINTYARLNQGKKPNKIVIFRDGVSDGQFDMVLNEELHSLETAVYDEQYKPEITLIVAQKRHHTRLFLKNDNEGVRPYNVPPGTVVDSKITNPSHYNFYLCSHFGGLGTSKSTHYQVLKDKHCFSSDQLQKLIYDLCFTFVRCTKPIKLVPPVCYADIVATRGRLYHNALKTYHSSSDTLVDENLYKVHSDLRDTMFFV